MIRQTFFQNAHVRKKPPPPPPMKNTCDVRNSDGILYKCGWEKKHIWEGVLFKLVYYLLFIRKKLVYYVVIIIMDIFKRISLKTLRALQNHEGGGGNGITKMIYTNVPLRLWENWEKLQSGLPISLLLSSNKLTGSATKTAFVGCLSHREAVLRRASVWLDIVKEKPRVTAKELQSTK